MKRMIILVSIGIALLAYTYYETFQLGMCHQLEGVRNTLLYHQREMAYAMGAFDYILHEISKDSLDVLGNKCDEICNIIDGKDDGKIWMAREE